MNMQELVRVAMEGNPRGFGKLPEKRAANLVRAVLEAVAAQIDGAEAGATVKIPVLGVFRVKPASEEGGARKVGFRRVTATGKGEGKGKGQGKGQGKGKGKGKVKDDADAAAEE